MQIDISLKNKELYDGCEIEEVNGRLNLTTPVTKAMQTVGRNIARMEIDNVSVTLTGAMAIWSYMIVFHSVLHRTKKVFYDDGRSGIKLLIAAHG